MDHLLRDNMTISSGTGSELPSAYIHRQIVEFNLDVEELSISDMDLSMDGLDDGDIASPPSRKRHLKRKRPASRPLSPDKCDDDDDDLLDMPMSDDESQETKRQRTSLLGLFDDDDDESSDSIDPRIPGTELPIRSHLDFLIEPFDDIEFSDAAEDANAPAVPRIVALDRVILDGFPVIQNTTDAIDMRCVFSSTGRQSESEPQHLSIVDDNAPFPSHIRRLPWVLAGREDACVGASSKRGKAAIIQKYARGLCGIGRTDDGKEEDEKDPEGAKRARPGIDTPYFVLIGESARYVASPFFAYRVSVVQLDPDAVQFAINPRIPVFLLRNVIEKRCFIDPTSAPEVWLKAVGVCLKDTLFVHLAAKQWQWDEFCTILNECDALPQAEDPSLRDVPADVLDIGKYSTRQERSKYITAVIRGPFRKLQKRPQGYAFNEQLASLLTSMQNLPGDPDLLFTDLEKRKEDFDLLATGMPIKTFSEISSWRTPSKEVIYAKLDYVRASLLSQKLSVAQVLLATQKKLPGQTTELRPMFLARNLHLDPAWFATCYTWICNRRRDDNTSIGSDEEQFQSRILVFRAFIYSDILHKALDNMSKYSSNMVFFFTKRQRDLYFEQGLFQRSSAENDARFVNTSTMWLGGDAVSTVNGSRALTESDGIAIADKVFWLFQHAGPPEFRVIERVSFGAPHPTRVAVNAKYIGACSAMCKVVDMVVRRWVASYTNALLGPELSATPPLVVKVSYKYGVSTVTNADALKTVVDVLSPFVNEPSEVGIMSPILDAKHRIAAIKNSRIIILVNFHQWKSETAMQLARDMERCVKDNTFACTHLVVVGNTGLIAQQCGEAMLCDLLETARDLEQRMAYLSGEDVYPLLAPKMLSTDAQTFFTEGARSDSHLSREWREVQWNANIASIVAHSKARDLMSYVTSTSRKSPVRSTHDMNYIFNAAATSQKADVHLLVLYGRFATAQKLKNILKPASLPMYGRRVNYVRYRDLRKNIEMLSRPATRTVILADVTTDATVYHINTAFSISTGGLCVWGCVLDEVESVYYKSDRSSDQQTMHMEQMPYLADKLRDQLTASDSALTRALATT